MPRDPVGLVVLIALLAAVVCIAIALLVRQFKVRSLYAVTDYAVGYAMLLLGLVLVGAASTIPVPVVPWIIGSLGLAFGGFGLHSLHVLMRGRAGR